MHSRHPLPRPPARAGKAQVLDTMRELVIVHKEKHIIPITMGVMRASGTGAESIFMAVFRVRLGGVDRKWLGRAGLARQRLRVPGGGREAWFASGMGGWRQHALRQRTAH